MILHRFGVMYARVGFIWCVGVKCETHLCKYPTGTSSCTVTELGRKIQVILKYNVSSTLDKIYWESLLTHVVIHPNY